MPSFSEEFGGPLREDQIRNLAAFIMNWEENAELVQAPPTPAGPVAGTDITKKLPEGDPVSGEQLAVSLACTACHIDAPTGPSWLAAEGEPAIGIRSAQRIEQSDYTGEAADAYQYLFESISDPNIFLVSGYAEGLMPGNYASSLTEQDLADLIAYLLSLE